MFEGYDISEFQGTSYKYFVLPLIVRVYNGWRPDNYAKATISTYEGRMLGVYTYIVGREGEIEGFAATAREFCGDKLYVPCLDWEQALNAQWGNEAYLERCIVKCIGLFGRSPMIYASSSVYPYALAKKYDCPMWIACSVLPKGVNPTVWQYKWNPVDCDRFYITPENWIKLCVGGKTKAPNPIIKAASKVLDKWKVTTEYRLHVKAHGWLSPVKDWGEGDDGFAGVPLREHDLLAVSVNHGTLAYRAHIMGGGWLPWVRKGDINNTFDGCAGIAGRVIDGVQCYFYTPSGESMQQVWYRAQTVKRTGWLGVVCDTGDSIKGYTDTYAGILGEPIDRLQIVVSDKNPWA